MIRQVAVLGRPWEDMRHETSPQFGASDYGFNQPLDWTGCIYRSAVVVRTHLYLSRPNSSCPSNHFQESQEWCKTQYKVIPPLSTERFQWNFVHSLRHSSLTEGLIFYWHPTTPPTHIQTHSFSRSWEKRCLIKWNIISLPFRHNIIPFRHNFLANKLLFCSMWNAVWPYFS